MKLYHISILAVKLFKICRKLGVGKMDKLSFVGSIEICRIGEWKQLFSFDIIVDSQSFLFLKFMSSFHNSVFLADLLNSKIDCKIDEFFVFILYLRNFYVNIISKPVIEYYVIKCSLTLSYTCSNFMHYSRDKYPRFFYSTSKINHSWIINSKYR